MRIAILMLLVLCSTLVEAQADKQTVKLEVSRYVETVYGAAATFLDRKLPDAQRIKAFFVKRPWPRDQRGILVLLRCTAKSAALLFGPDVTRCRHRNGVIAVRKRKLLQPREPAPTTRCRG